MPSINLSLPVAGTPITAGLHATNYAALQALLNGGLDSSNVNFATGGVVPFNALGITLGGDVNLYRSAANVLKTDDVFHVGSIQIDHTAPFVGGAGNMDLRSASDVYVSAMGALGTVTLRNLTSGNYGLIMQPTGRVDLMAVGLTLGTDVNLYRPAANTLQTDDNLDVVGYIRGVGGSSIGVVGAAGAAASIFYSQVAGDTITRFNTQADGKIEWGPGNAARDTNLYRSAANTLTTDDTLSAGGGGARIAFHSYVSAGGTPFFYARPGDANERFSINDIGSLSWGSGASATDTNLYRSGAGVLRTDAAFIASAATAFTWDGSGWVLETTTAGVYAMKNLNILLAAGDANAQIVFSRNYGGVGLPGIAFGPGGATATDTDLYRSAANTLRTNDAFVAASHHYISGEQTIRGGDGGNWKQVSGSSVPTTDASGIATVVFGITFASAPIVVYVNGDNGTPWTDGGIVPPTGTTSFSVKTSVISSAVRIDWIAYGKIA